MSSVMDMLNEDNLEISIYPRGNTGYIFTPHVADNGDLSWTNDGGLENPPIVNIKGPRGPQGLIQFLIVETLPEIGSSEIMYLVPYESSRGNNLYNEYIWVNNAFEMVSEGRQAASEQAQYDVGYYYNTTIVSTLNNESYLYNGEYALIIDENTIGKPENITEENKIILKTFQSDWSDNKILYQELITLEKGEKYHRTITEENNLYNYTNWVLDGFSEIKISSSTPQEESIVLWIDESQEAEIFDPNNYYTKTESETRMNTVKMKTLCLNSGAIQLPANGVYTYTVDYSEVIGTILGSCLIGCIGTVNNNEITLTPHIAGTTENSTLVSSVTIKTITAQNVYVNILVFYR